MFAIIKDGGKQYKVKAGDVVRLARREAKEGSTIELGNVLLVGGDKPSIHADGKGAAVKAEVLEHGKDDKVIVFKKKRRHNYRRKIGHRQQYTAVRILGDNEKPAVKKAAPKAEEKKAEAKTAAKKAAPKQDTAKKADAKPAAKKKTSTKKDES
jgi:large subunit ribosomal protein L21